MQQSCSSSSQLSTMAGEALRTHQLVILFNLLINFSSLSYSPPRDDTQLAPCGPQHCLLMRQSCLISSLLFTMAGDTLHTH